jgi:hypothetical protein
LDSALITAVTLRNILTHVSTRVTASSVGVDKEESRLDCEPHR